MENPNAWRTTSTLLLTVAKVTAPASLLIGYVIWAHQPTTAPTAALPSPNHAGQHSPEYKPAWSAPERMKCYPTDTVGHDL
jgi:hypothetical protein